MQCKLIDDYACTCTCTINTCIKYRSALKPSLQHYDSLGAGIESGSILV